MKNILYILLIACAAACTGKAIDLDQKSSIPYSEAFSSAERCELTLLGCYAFAQGSYRGYPFGSRSAEHCDVRGEDIASSSYFSALYNATFTTSGGDGSNQWTYLFKLVNQINIVIEGVQDAAQKGIISTTIANTYQAEARFLRALALHEAVVFFAQPYQKTADASHYGVPVITVACNTIEAVENAMQGGRSSVKATYDQILEDLNFAEKYLPANRLTPLHICRATQGAVIALKTRIYQHQYNWEEVLTEVNKLVPNTLPFKSPVGSYQLTANVDGPFTNQQANTESIFSIENSKADNPTMDGCLGQVYFGRKDLAISPIIYNASFWKKNDLRRSELLQTADGKFYTKKYPNYINMDDWAPLLRYAEVLLNGAEAEARINGKTQRALDLLNAVRNRAVKETLQQYTLQSFANAEALIQAILDERRIEFLAEGRRWYDIHRLSTDPKFAVKTSNGVAGIPKKVNYGSILASDYVPESGNVRAKLLTVSEIPSSDRRFVLPIPQKEIDANPVIASQQNEGW